VYPNQGAAALARLQLDEAPVVRISGLRALRLLGGGEVETAIELALRDSDAQVRMAAIEAMPVMPINDAIKADELEIVIVGRELESLATALPAALQTGGDARNGGQLVLQHPTALCVRCHTLGESESTVGPPLDGIGGRLARAELLESLLDPSASIAEGFGVDVASAMRPKGSLLSHRQLRDIVEFLSTER
jgi:hypothetical protein